MPAKNLQRISDEGVFVHVYNKGVESRILFADDDDYKIFIGYLEEYLSSPKALDSTKKVFKVKGREFKGVPHQPKNYEGRVELVAYSLMPDHFHLVLHQVVKNSLQNFIRSLCTRYSIYFNKKYERRGSLFEGPYKSTHINGTSELSLLTRYLHKEGENSSYPEYLGKRNTPWVKTKVISSFNEIGNKYKEFVESYEPNQKDTGLLERITIEKVPKPLERRDLVKSEPEIQEPSLEIVPAKSSHTIQYLTTAVMFFLLLGLGTRNILAAKDGAGVAISIPNTSQVLGAFVSEPVRSPTPEAIVPPSPSPSPAPKEMVKVKITDGAYFVNIRKEPSIASEKVGEALEGQLFELESKTTGWYGVRLKDGIGYISTNYIEEVKGELAQ